MMSKNWGSGDPNQALTNNDTSYLAYDDHRYLKYNTSIALTKDSYLSASCGENVASDAQDAQDTPIVVSEWSLSPAQAVEGLKAWAPESKSNKKFYKKWFAAQVHAFEKGALGWVFWGWKQELGDYRWGYQGMFLSFSSFGGISFIWGDALSVLRVENAVLTLC